MLQPGGLHPMFFHDLFISPSALSESPTLGQGDTCRKDQRSVSYSYKKPWNPQEFWEHGTLGGTWRNTKMNEFAPCPPRVRIHPDNSCWSAAVSELPSRASLTSLSLTLGPGNYPLFLDWWWPCQKAACYTEDMSTSALSCLMQEEKEVVRKDRREFAGCSEVQTRHSHWREPAQAMQPKKKKKPRSLCVTWLFSPAKQGGSTSSSFAKTQLWCTTSRKFVLWNESSATSRLVTTTCGEGSICHQWNQALLDLAYKTASAECIQKTLFHRGLCELPRYHKGTRGLQLRRPFCWPWPSDLWVNCKRSAPGLTELLMSYVCPRTFT